jgi:hypothetical protein
MKLAIRLRHCPLVIVDVPTSTIVEIECEHARATLPASDASAALLTAPFPASLPRNALDKTQTLAKLAYR